ncbi:MAG: hypothetical protein HYZ28_18670 [Myxococcales bacterium]|nr:hypothetical protein [Myxococcales bacterium]
MLRHAVVNAWSIAMVLSLPLVAGASDSSGKTAPAPASEQVTVVGTNYCLGCALKKQHGAAAQCSKYGHRHVLKVERALDAGGKELAELSGKTLGYLENEKAEKLFKGDAFHAARVEVKGRHYPKESVIEVQEYKAP